MQDNTMQAAFQPYVKLVQSNMELLGRYSMSPETLSQAVAQAQSLFTPGASATPPLAQSAAFVELVQGMIKNYTEFMAELAQGNMALLSQAQATLVQQTQQATEGAAGAARGRAGRG